MGVVIRRAWLRALVVLGALAFCAGVGAHAEATRAFGGGAGLLSVEWLSPQNGSTVNGILRGATCEVAVHDTVPITKVTFGVGESTFATDTAPPYTCEIRAAGLSPRMHILKAKAYDASGRALSAYVYVSTRWTGRPRVTVTVQGDSLTVGSWWRIPADLGPHYELVSYSGHVGRPAGKGLQLLHGQRLGRVVVFARPTRL